jgi:hypothetical protein
MKRNIVLFILVFAFAGVAVAQENYGTVTWNMGFSTGDQEKYINNESFRGFGFEGYRFTEPNLSVGMAFSWNVFAQKFDNPDSITIQIENGHATGVQTRYINVFPFQLGARRFFGTDPYKTRLFVGGAAGLYYIIQRFDIGVFSVKEDHFHFGLMPEAGIMIPIAETHVFASFRYHYIWGSSGSIDYSYMGINLGFLFSEYL